MFRFTEDVKAFRRFSLKLRAENHKIKDLKSIGAEMEATIFNGFKIHNPNLGGFISMCYLRKRDEEKALKLFERPIKQLLKDQNPKRKS